MVHQIKEADVLGVFWGEKGSPMEGTDDDRVIVELDTEGNLQGFQIEGVTKLEDAVLKIRVPALGKVE